MHSAHRGVCNNMIYQRFVLPYQTGECVEKDSLLSELSNTIQFSLLLPPYVHMSSLGNSTKPELSLFFHFFYFFILPIGSEKFKIFSKSY